MRRKVLSVSALLFGLCAAQSSSSSLSASSSSSTAQTFSTPAAKCSSTLTADYPEPSVYTGLVARLVANGLTDPRSIKFDSDGHLLVVEAGKGITALTLEDNGGGCISESSREKVVSDSTLNHGMELSHDGKTLYASNPESVYSWDYSPSSLKVDSSSQATIITNMTTTDHVTRTLLLSKFDPSLMIVTRGSTSNIDPLASVLSSGHSQIKAYNIMNSTGPYDFNTQGRLLGWGLRNEVGIDEEPLGGGIYSVENSVDQMTRNGKDIHQTNPAEEMNFLGYLNKPSPNEGRNFGYPECFTAWDVGTIPDYNGAVGEQFAIGDIRKTNNDEMCSAAHRQPPRLPFHPHMAPLDILFNDQGSAAWVTFHGSWDSDPPVGYKLAFVQFADGHPTEPNTSKVAAIDALWNADVTQCGSVTCFRPVGLAWDKKGNLFMSSDATGEIYAILRQDGRPTNSMGKNVANTNHAPSGNAAASLKGVSFAEAALASLTLWLSCFV